ncbi:MAG: dTDP-4-dehydrorhamnose reductase [Bacteroidota bacterium]
MNASFRIGVTGVNGQVGNAIQELSKQFPEVTWTFLDREEMDLSDTANIVAHFAANQYTHFISCAAYTAVDKAEQESELSDKINHRAAAEIATQCAQQNATLIHLSTDYVYHNGVDRPLLESDPTQPQGVYAQTKLLGDHVALANNPKTIILRTSWVYAPIGKNFVHTMLRLGQERESLRVVFDQVGTPTYAPHLAQAILDIIQSPVLQGAPEEWSGIYHYSNEGVTSWFDFAIAIFALAELDCQVFPITSAEYPTPAQRPTYSVLNKAKIKQRFDLSIPHWHTGLANCLQTISLTSSF